MKKFIYLIIAICTLNFVFAKYKVKPIYIDVIYSGVQKDTLTIEYQHNGTSLSALEKVKLNDPELNNHFEVNPGLQDKIVYLTIGGKKEYLIIQYLAEPGDSIQIYVTSEKLKFRGRGSEKYQCRYEMDKINNIFPWESVRVKYNLNNGESVLDSLYYTNYIPDSFSILNRQYAASKCSQEVLNWYKGRLSEFIYTLLLANLLADTEEKIWRNFTSCFTKFDSSADLVQKKDIRDSLMNIYLNRNSPGFNMISDSVLAYSHKYLAYVSKKTSRKKHGFGEALAFRNDSLLLKSEVETLAENYKGKLRDKIITQFLLTNFTDLPNISSLIRQAQKIVIDPECKRLLVSLSLTNTQGSKAFAFNLPDFSGKIRTLDEFRGKVIIMDFWFTGCGSCRVMAENLKPIVEHFKNNNNIVFISVSADENINTWRNSIIKEIYTNKYSIDLFTQGEGTSHPIIKNYKIESYPTLLMIGKDGKIITTSILQPKTERDKQKLISFIEKYI
ncbi:TlpA disulfide reductase family protein [Sphingobacterium sp. DR205]|uniref:TlpA family protein disulfide reductase n=1 Tax=Sphingobacterium sp. DR205 TaxID=2713573 RepID=UPI0013E4B3B1|nr:TlpA disulfide reductase family protein [Sphingobacterium sp. DR205]QIH34465.1 TlpA family protein disulfide reductase [Sphingobacterium sp. DR205]